MSLRNRIATTVEKLTLGSDSDDVSARSRSGGSYGYHTLTRDRAVGVHVPKDLDRDWRIYRSTPLVRRSINQYAEDVTADGYRVVVGEENDDPEGTQAFLTQWCERGAVFAGEQRHDLLDLLRAIPVQLEARGTALIEHVPFTADADADRTGALSLIDPATVRPYTRPGTDMLVSPGDTHLDDVVLTDDGEAAAYVQRRGGANERALSQRDVTKLVKDPDTADVFGMGSVNAVADRIEAIKKKLADNEKAIETTAYGRWFYTLPPQQKEDSETGEVETIEFSDEAYQKFRHTVESAEPGDEILLDKRIEYENLPGEVAEIEAYLRFDIDWIVSVLPAPKYALGAFDSDINRRVTQEQQPRYERSVDDIQGDISRALTPVLRTVAEQNGYDPTGVTLSLEAPAETNPVLSRSVEENQSAATLYAAVGGRLTPEGAAELLGVPEEWIAEQEQQGDADDDTGGTPFARRSTVDKSDGSAEWCVDADPLSKTNGGTAADRIAATERIMSSPGRDGEVMIPAGARADIPTGFGSFPDPEAVERAAKNYSVTPDRLRRRMENGGVDSSDADADDTTQNEDNDTHE